MSESLSVIQVEVARLAGLDGFTVIQDYDGDADILRVIVSKPGAKYGYPLTFNSVAKIFNPEDIARDMYGHARRAVSSHVETSHDE